MYRRMCTYDGLSTSSLDSLVLWMPHHSRCPEGYKGQALLKALASVWARCGANAGRMLLLRQLEMLERGRNPPPHTHTQSLSPFGELAVVLPTRWP